MYHFQNTVKNPSFKLSTKNISIAFVAANTPAYQTTIQKDAQIGTNNAQVLTLQKTVKYCTFCKHDYHTETKCCLKHPHLASSKLANKLSQKQRQGGNNDGNIQNALSSITDKNLLSYFSENQLITFLATPQPSSLFNNAWV